MKTKRFLWLALTGSLVTTLSLAQTANQHCSAAFLGKRLLVNQYSPKGVCRMPSTATGSLSVWTVNLTEKETKPLTRIPFQVAIRDKETKTLQLVSKTAHKEVEVRQLLNRCRKGDHIVLLTLNQQYALPHNEIIVE